MCIACGFLHDRVSPETSDIAGSVIVSAALLMRECPNGMVVIWGPATKRYSQLSGMSHVADTHQGISASLSCSCCDGVSCVRVESFRSLIVVVGVSSKQDSVSDRKAASSSGDDILRSEPHLYLVSRSSLAVRSRRIDDARTAPGCSKETYVPSLVMM